MTTKQRDTFIYVGEMGGDCPIHGRRGSIHGSGAQRHPCGCPQFRGEKKMTAKEVRREAKKSNMKSNMTVHHDGIVEEFATNHEAATRFVYLQLAKKD
jgi:hypothetical protein